MTLIPDNGPFDMADPSVCYLRIRCPFKQIIPENGRGGH